MDYMSGVQLKDYLKLNKRKQQKKRKKTQDELLELAKTRSELANTLRKNNKK